MFPCGSVWCGWRCRAYYGEEGEVFDKYEDMDNLWSYVSHFHAVPFYVYAYAFADLLVGSLYNVYKTHPQGFEEKLLGLLAGGSTKDFVTALRPFGLDPSRPEFWTDALTSHLGKSDSARKLLLCALCNRGETVPRIIMVFFILRGMFSGAMLGEAEAAATECGYL